MKGAELINQFYRWRKDFGRAFDIVDIHMMFPEASRPSLLTALSRHADAGLVVRVTRGIYCLQEDTNYPYLLEHAASKLRRGSVCYVSQESYLSEAGVISQQMIDQLILMTTGRTGSFTTPRGTIELRHTRRSIPELNALCTYNSERRVWIPPAWLAYEDLKSARRNLDLVDMSELKDLIDEESRQI